MNNISTLKNLYQKLFTIIFSANILLFSATLYASAVTDTVGSEVPGSKIPYDKKSTSVELGTSKNKIIHDQRPTALEYALMSQCAYKDSLKKGDRCDDLPGWEIHDSANKIVESNTGFNYLIFKNDDTRQIVIAYRGTVPTSLNDLWEDILGIGLNTITPQKKEAFKLVFDAVKLVDKEIIDYIRGKGYTLSFTGHSLGAFLAEMSVFFCHENQINYPLAGAVTFESPGSIESMQALQATLDPKIDLSDLDIIGYVGTPNVINTANHYVGSLYQIEHDLGEGGNSIMYTLNCHSIDNIVSYFKKCISGSCGMHYMARWPLFSLTQEQSRNYFELSRWDEKCKFYRIPEEYFAHPERVFFLKYTAGYDINEIFQPFYSLSLKHVQPGLRNFLLKYRDTFSAINQDSSGKEKFIAELSSKKVPKEIITYLVGIKIAKNQNDDMLYLVNVENKAPQDVFRVRNKLSEYLQDEGTFKKVINVFNTVCNIQKRCDLDKLNNVPSPVPYFQEREEETNALHNIVAKNNETGVKLVGILGFSGSGKTQLALKYAHEHKNDYHHIRFFKANAREKLLDGFSSLATDLCATEFYPCLHSPRNETCTMDIVRRCLEEVAGNFLWIFDDVQTDDDLKGYIPRERNGIILITTQNRLNSLRSSVLDLDRVLLDKEASNLLSKVIKEKSKNLSKIIHCNKQDIEKIALGACKNFPTPIVYTGTFIVDQLFGNCSRYIKLYKVDPKAIDVYAAYKANIGRYYKETQGDLIRKQIKNLKDLNIDAIIFLSFVEIPIPKNLLISYISTNPEYRKLLQLGEHSKYKSTIQEDLDDLEVEDTIRSFSLVKEDEEEWVFLPHDVVIEQAQILLLELDSEKEGIYADSFNRVSGFFCKVLPDSASKENVIFKQVLGKMIPFFANDTIKETSIPSYKNKGREKLQTIDDCKLTLQHKLAKYHIEDNYEYSIISLNKLLDKIGDNEFVK